VEISPWRSCALAAIGTLNKGQVGGSVILILIATLAGFNIHVATKAARLLSEEEWLAAEVRKTELRKKLAALQAEDGPVGPPLRRLTHEPGSV
jgi:hypothetical protein